MFPFRLKSMLCESFKKHTLRRTLKKKVVVGFGQLDCRHTHR